MDQKRADVLADLGRLVFDESVAPADRRGGAPAIQVVVSLSTFLGYDDDPAELAGYGPIHAGLARELAADPTGTWQRLITDTAGHWVVRRNHDGTTTWNSPTGRSFDKPPDDPLAA